MKYIKSPLNYTGGKYKLLKDIMPLFPDSIDTFVDLFGGGFNVGINVKAKTTVYNDINNYVVELMQYLYDYSVEYLLQEIDGLIWSFDLSKDNEIGYYCFRDYYNKRNRNPIVFYTLLCYAFNNQIRFNSYGEYNIPFGKGRSFNDTMKKNFIDFVVVMHKKKIYFGNVSFDKFNFDALTGDDLVYCDPPYLGSDTTYNANGGWTTKHEIKLLNILDMLDNMGIRFALSNNLSYENPLLKKWMHKYNIYYLNADYNNCNYHKKTKDVGKEVLITNYY